MHDLQNQKSMNNSTFCIFIVKISNCILSPVLAKLFNKCIKLETFPNSFKMAYVVPVAKVLSPKSLGDFRPISLLSVFSKVFEKIIETNMTKFINKNNILTPSQFGFRENSSTDLPITTFYDKLLNNINDGKAQSWTALFRAFSSHRQPSAIFSKVFPAEQTSWPNWQTLLACTEADADKLTRLPRSRP